MGESNAGAPLTVQVRLFGVRDEELAPVRVRSAICHGHDTP